MVRVTQAGPLLQFVSTWRESHSDWRDLAAYLSQVSSRASFENSLERVLKVLFLQHTGRRYKPKAKDANKDLESKPKFKHQTKVASSSQSLDATRVEELPGSTTTTTLVEETSSGVEAKSSEVTNSTNEDETEVKDDNKSTPETAKPTKVEQQETKQSDLQRQSREKKRKNTVNCDASTSKTENGATQLKEAVVKKLNVEEWRSSEKSIEFMFAKSGDDHTSRKNCSKLFLQFPQLNLFPCQIEVPVRKRKKSQ